MEYLFGFTTCLALIGTYYSGYKTGRKAKPETLEIDEQTKMRAKKMQEDFQAIMNYDLTQAMQRKRVI